MKNTLKGIAVLLALLALIMEMNWVDINIINISNFWILLIGFILLLVANR